MNTTELEMKKLNLIQKNNIIAMDNINSKQNIESKQITELTEKLAELNAFIVKYNITEGQVYDVLIKQKNELEQQFNTLNVNNQNNLNIKEFAKKIITKEHDTKKYFKKFIESTSINALIHSPTQVGKTAATKDFIEICLDAKLPVIVSCDNKSDQLEQFYNRIANDFNSSDVTLVKACNPKIGKILKDCFENDKKVIIFCLDNASQIKKIKEQIVLLMTLENIKLKKIVIAHDEGDVITKDYNIEDLENDQSERHKEWIKMIQYFSNVGSNKNKCIK